MVYLTRKRRLLFPRYTSAPCPPNIQILKSGWTMERWLEDWTTGSSLSELPLKSWKGEFKIRTADMIWVTCWAGFYATDSVTRFGKISPLWQSFEGLWQLVKGSFSIWQNYNLLWQISCAIELILIVKMAKYRKSNLVVWSHWLLSLITNTSTVDKRFMSVNCDIKTAYN